MLSRLALQYGASNRDVMVIVRSGTVADAEVRAKQGSGSGREDLEGGREGGREGETGNGREGGRERE